MLLKVLDENRVKVLMEEDDIDFFDLPFEKLNYDDPYSRSFIYDLFKKTYEQTGVDFKNCRVMIEVIPGVSKAYYILLSKMKDEAGEQIEFDKAELTETDQYIYSFDSAENVFFFVDQIRRFFPQRIDLYSYNSKYYMVLCFLPAVTQKHEFGILLSELEEFGERCKFKYENEAVLVEWGIHIIGSDVMDICKNLETPGK